MFPFSSFLIMIVFTVLLFWIAVIVGTVLLIIYLLKYNQKDKESRSPEEILEQRFAKGEINEKELEEKRKKLRQ